MTEYEFLLSLHSIVTLDNTHFFTARTRNQSHYKDSRWFEDKTTKIDINGMIYWLCDLPDIHTVDIEKNFIKINNHLCLSERTLFTSDNEIEYSPLEYRFRHNKDGTLTEIILHEIPEEMNQNVLEWTEEDQFYYRLHHD